LSFLLFLGIVEGNVFFHSPLFFPCKSIESNTKNLRFLIRVNNIFLSSYIQTERLIVLLCNNPALLCLLKLCQIHAIRSLNLCLYSGDYCSPGLKRKKISLFVFGNLWVIESKEKRRMWNRVENIKRETLWFYHITHTSPTTYFL